MGVDSDRYLNYFDYDILGHKDDQAVIENLLTGRKLILGTAVRDKYNLEEGQVITLDTGNGMRDYEIGFVNTKKNGGIMGLTSRSVLKNDLKRGWGLRMAIQAQDGFDVDEMVTKIEGKLKNLDWYEANSMSKRKQEYMEENKDNHNLICLFIGYGPNW